MSVYSYLAFDLGASSSRAILGTLDEGKMHMETLHRFVTPMLTEGDHLRWDIDTLGEELLKGLNSALNVAPNLRSLSVDSWGVDYVRLDASGKPIEFPYCYRDRRTEGIMDKVFSVLPASTIYERTGIQFLPFNTLYQAMADLVQDGSDKTALHLSIADYYNYLFSGIGVWDASMASTSQMKVIARNEWDGYLFDQLGFNIKQWPRIVPSGTVLGPVKTAPSVQAVATCSHDTGCAIAAAPATDGQKWAYISCGTWSLLGVERAAAIATDAARKAGYTHEVGIDNTYRFLKNIVGLWVVQECVREWGNEADWEKLTRDASRADSTGHIIELEDHRFIARGHMQARLAAYCKEVGFTLPDDRPGIIRLVLESIAASYAINLERLEGVIEEHIEVIHLFGGGAQNQLLCQLTANATRLPVIAGPVEATALGNLLIQARTMGDLPEGETIRSIARNSSELVTYFPEQV